VIKNRTQARFIGNPSKANFLFRGQAQVYTRATDCWFSVNGVGQECPNHTGKGSGQGGCVAAVVGETSPYHSLTRFWNRNGPRKREQECRKLLQIRASAIPFAEKISIL
jgi:hypothetical protein